MASDPLIAFQAKHQRLDRARVRALAAAVSARVAAGATFLALVTSDARLRALNRQFRGIDAATDVLSFPAPSPSGYLGDIAISLPRARAQAAERGHSIEDEIGILLLHGVLHLLGHDHHTDRGRMRRLESRWRRELGLPAGLIERARSLAR